MSTYRNIINPLALDEISAGYHVVLPFNWSHDLMKAIYALSSALQTRLFCGLCYSFWKKVSQGLSHCEKALYSLEDCFYR